MASFQLPQPSYMQPDGYRFYNDPGTSQRGSLPNTSVGSFRTSFSTNPAYDTVSQNTDLAQSMIDNAGGDVGFSQDYWGPGSASYDNLLSGFQGQRDNIYGSARTAGEQAGSNLNLSILDYINNLNQAQQTIDESRIGNWMSRQQGGRDVQSMVGRGVQSGQDMLSNMNAADSSASDAIARAYGDIGTRQLSDVYNQYELADLAANQAQQQYGTDADLAAQGIENQRTGAINNIVDAARDNLAALDAEMVGASIADRFNLEQEKAAIRSEVQQMLTAYDAQSVAQKRQAVQAMGTGGVRGEAVRRAGLGRAAAQDYLGGGTQTAPSLTGQFGASTGSDDVPIYLAPQDEEQE